MARLPLPDPTVVLTCSLCGASGPANEVFYLPVQPGVTTEADCRRAFDLLRGTFGG